MADIQQWRRMIQPARARTPAAPEQDEMDALATPATPKRGIKPKISSYFTHNAGNVTASKAEPSISAFHNDFFEPKLPSWAADEPYPEPSADGLMDSVMCSLLTSPYEALEPRFNGMLLHIFECFRDLKDVHSHLQLQLHEEADRSTALERRLQAASKQWSDERQDFKVEVKRLELLLAKGKRGVAEVTQARQESLLRQKAADRRSRLEDDGLQTIFEFLEKTKRYDDKAWNNQRATFRVRQPSPSAQMKRLSQQLLSKKSFTNIHADLPFGTPPSATPSTLAQASLLEELASHDDRQTRAGAASVSDPKTSLSDDTFSTFSCIGDSLQGEVPDRIVTDTSTESELLAIQRLTIALARRKHIDPSDVMSKLFGMFAIQPPPLLRGTNTPVPDQQLPTPKSIGLVMTRSKTTTGLRKQPSLISKASGFFQRLKPQMHTDASVSLTPRFSFEAGDDLAPVDLSTPGPGLITPDANALRKSASTSFLPEGPDQSSPPVQLASTVAGSPTTSDVASEITRVSKTSNPASGTTALPAQIRENSASSLLTIVQQADHSQGHGSNESRVYSPRSHNRKSSPRGPSTPEQSRGILVVGASTSARSNGTPGCIDANHSNAYSSPLKRQSSHRRGCEKTTEGPFFATATAPGKITAQATVNTAHSMPRRPTSQSSPYEAASRRTRPHAIQGWPYESAHGFDSGMNDFSDENA